MSTGIFKISHLNKIKKIMYSESKTVLKCSTTTGIHKKLFIN